MLLCLGKGTTNSLRAFLLLNYLWTKLEFLLASFSTASAFSQQGEICLLVANKWPASAPSTSPTATGGGLVSGYQPAWDRWRTGHRNHMATLKGTAYTLDNYCLENGQCILDAQVTQELPTASFWVQRSNWFLNMRCPSGESIPWGFQSIPHKNVGKEHQPIH